MRTLPYVLLLVLPLWTLADDAAECTTDQGSYLSGEVVKAPTFARGKRLHGVALSHTHLSLKSDSDGKVYDVAIDNVFASGYDKAGSHVPAPLDTLAVGDKLEVCGQPFPGGIHWVHTNCGKQPTKNQPNGWVRKMSDGKAGENMEGSEEYCKLWH